jgi:hypothetical protein
MKAVVGVGRGRKTASGGIWARGCIRRCGYLTGGGVF